MGSFGHSVSDGGRGGGGGAPVVDKGVDFAQYFCTYAYLYHQKEMLSDRVRMDAYYNAVFKNEKHFQGKTVLDVGTGSGILAIWSAQAGARKVYAVEATKMSEHALALVKANNLQDVVEVIESSMEDVTLPEKVDVIISEWMGYFLLRESMFDSVICARDRWLKPNGVMYPSHARMWMAPIRSALVNQKMNQYEGAMDDWYSFLKETRSYYGVDMSVLTRSFDEEQKKYFLHTSFWSNIQPEEVIGTPAVVCEIDCLTATVHDIAEVRSQFSSEIHTDARLCGFGGWFDVHFRGRVDNPAKEVIELTTEPSEDNGTHWGQQVFLVQPPRNVCRGDCLNLSFSMKRTIENHRLMEIELDCEFKHSSGELLQPFKKTFYIEGYQACLPVIPMSWDNLLPPLMKSLSPKNFPSGDLPSYDPAPGTPKKDNRSVHLIPLVLGICFLILWLSPWPVKQSIGHQKCNVS